jgi:hypothetical protein
MVPLLSIGQDVKRQLHVKHTDGQDRCQDQHHLRQRHRWRFFFNLRRMRTTKKCARITNVI